MTRREDQHWQTIDNAPLDGVNVDIWAVFEGHGQRWPNAWYNESEGFWIVTCQSGEGHLVDGWTVTHWMPAPEPPA